MSRWSGNGSATASQRGRRAIDVRLLQNRPRRGRSGPWWSAACRHRHADSGPRRLTCRHMSQPFRRTRAECRSPLPAPLSLLFSGNPERYAYTSRT